MFLCLVSNLHLFRDFFYVKQINDFLKCLDTLCEAEKDDDGHALNLKGIFHYLQQKTYK